MLRKVIYFILIVAILIGLASCDSTVPVETEVINIPGVKPSGEGSMTKPYLIQTFENLIWIAENIHEWDKHYKQINDINATSSIQMHSGKGWLPIGRYYNDFSNNELIEIDFPFTGVYDGNDKTISNLFINQPQSNNLALFGMLQSGIVKNLGFINLIIKGNNNIGGVAGINNGLIINCYSTGSVVGSGDNIGGIAGINHGTIANSYNLCDVKSFSNFSGGLTGSNYGYITKSFNAGDLIGVITLGGVTGQNFGNISDCFNLGMITGESIVGGLVGENISGTITRTYSVGKVTASSESGGLIALNFEGSITLSYWNIQTSTQSNSAGGIGKSSAQMKIQHTYTDWDFNALWSLSSSKNSGYPHLKQLQYFN